MIYIACEYLGGDLEVHDDDLEKAEWVKISELNSYFTTPLYEKVGEYLHNHLKKQSFLQVLKIIIDCKLYIQNTPAVPG